jgi:hypothetical protein
MKAGARRAPGYATGCVKTQKSSKTGEEKSFDEAEKFVTGQM